MPQLREERLTVLTGPLLMVDRLMVVVTGSLLTVDMLMWALSQNYKEQPRRLPLFCK
jgi:hypothetical protein